MMVDPAFPRVVALALGVLFAASAFAKLRDPGAFAGTVANYRLLPAIFFAPAAWIIIAGEAAVAAGLFLGLRAAMAAAALMLAVYGGAMAVNLLRGRTHVDCGCLGYGGARPTIGWDLVARNLLLALVAGPLAFLPLTERTLGAADWISITGAVAAASFLYLLFEQLSAIRSRARMVQA